jgi:hypothetical protein
MGRGRGVALGALLLAATGAGAAGSLDLSLQRGLETHTGSVALELSRAGGDDSLHLQLHSEGLAGFRPWNRSSRRLTEALRLDAFHRLQGALSARVLARQSLYNEKRSLRETLAGSLDGGLHWQGPLQASLLAGWMREQRQRGGDHGPRLSALLSGALEPAHWRLEGEGLWRAENPGERRNREARFALAGRYDEADLASNQFRLLAEHRQEEFFPDPVRPELERRLSRSYELNERLTTRPATGLAVEAGLAGWSRLLDRHRSAGESRALDRGLRIELEGRLQVGALRGRLLFSLLRQQEESEQRGQVAISETRSRIQANRLESEWLWRPQDDSLRVFGRLELRRRDTEFEGGSLRDPDFLDQLGRELRLDYSRRLADWARLGLEFALSVEGERHLQASRSHANAIVRRWSAGSRHRLQPLEPLRLSGRAQALAIYRLFDHDEAGQPRSWLQRRFSWEEHLRWEVLRRGPGSWALEADGSWILEDGGRFRRTDGRELLSDSADERRINGGLAWRTGPWQLRPGLSWTGRRDWSWSLEDGRRSSQLVRELFRRGPALLVERSGPRASARLTLLWERVDDGGEGRRPQFSRNLWLQASATLAF